MPSPRPTRRSLLALAGLAVAFSGAPASGQILARRRLRLIPPEAHPWARFKPGAWKTVATETIVYSRDGKIIERTRSESTTRIVQHDAKNCRLQIETSTEVPGRESVETPREISLPIDPVGEDVEVASLGEEEIQIGEVKHRVEVRQAKLQDKSGEKLMTVHLTDDRKPKILKRETKVVDPKKGQPQALTKTEVVELDVPRTVDGEELLTAKVRTVHEHPAGKIETTEYLCDDVPGEVVSQESETFDAAGVLVRRSTVELIEFGKDNKRRPRRLFGRADRDRQSN